MQSVTIRCIFVACKDLKEYKAYVNKRRQIYSMLITDEQADDILEVA